MNINVVKTTPYSDQNPGTSGLRKKVAVIQKPNYLENFVQSVFNALPSDERNILVIGGDGRFYNNIAIQIVIRMAVANGYKRLIIGQNGLLSTPAVSNLIRIKQANGGMILSASHNPAGPDQDFGIKYNNENGSPASNTLSASIFAASLEISQYTIADISEVNLRDIGDVVLNRTTISVIDSVQDYIECMKRCFDFPKLRKAFASERLSIRFDAMHAVTGPYARSVFVDELGASSDSIINGEPREDFGGGHPDPNLVHAKALFESMHDANAPVLAAASDGDGDRNMILGQGCFVSPGDSLAILAEHHKIIPQFKEGLCGVARSMPTSTAIDRIAEDLGIQSFETPTGWKFFGNLLDTSNISLCGEESFGTSGNHIREKDGVWAVLFWLSILEASGKNVSQLLVSHWQRFGRSMYCRLDYEGISADVAADLMKNMQFGVSESRLILKHTNIAGADSFEYIDPVDGSVSSNQGIRVFLTGGSRIVYRLSGTGTDSATLRIYLEQYTNSAQDFVTSLDIPNATADLAKMAVELAEISQRTGMTSPSLVT